jgi:uncharacterized membrane protein
MTIRHFYNLRHAGLPNPWWVWAVAGAAMVAIGYLSWAGARISMEVSAATPAVTLDQVADVVATRCTVCHAAEPVWAGFVHPPKNVLLDTAENVRLHRKEIAINAVLSNAMPPGNVTEITDEERRLIGAGLAQLAATK